MGQVNKQEKYINHVLFGLIQQKNLLNTDAKGTKQNAHIKEVSFLKEHGCLKFTIFRT